MMQRRHKQRIANMHTIPMQIVNCKAMTCRLTGQLQLAIQSGAISHEKARTSPFSGSFRSSLSSSSAAATPVMLVRVNWMFAGAAG